MTNATRRLACFRNPIISNPLWPREQSIIGCLHVYMLGSLGIFLNGLISNPRCSSGSTTLSDPTSHERREGSLSIRYPLISYTAPPFGIGLNCSPKARSTSSYFVHPSWRRSWDGGSRRGLRARVVQCIYTYPCS